MLHGDDQEWLEADELGGFASGTVSGLRTRRYHALLLTATRPPSGRVVLVNGLEAWVETATGSVPITSQRYTPGMVYPDGYQHCVAFSRAPWPTWIYALQDGTRLVHEVFVAPDTCETVLFWRQESGVGPCRLTVRPLLSGRDYHALHHENPAFRFTATVQGGNVAWRPYPDQPAVAALTNGRYRDDPQWYRNFLYSAEQARGLDCVEDLASPGIFTFDLDAAPAVMVLRTGDGLSVRPAAYAEALRADGLTRRRADPLDLAARAYRVDRREGRTLIAGFPWFTDWGRDTFISMRGLVIGLDLLDEAELILTAWAEAVSEGMLPNRFPDGDAPPEYNAVDASLWYIVAVHEFLERCAATSRTVAPVRRDVLRDACVAILEGYTSGTRYGIACDADGLLRAGVRGVQLTWMDAKVEDRVITPRIGKPVEVQALWINGLRIAAQHGWGEPWRAMADKAASAFLARFPAPEGGLYDVVDVDHEPGAVDARVRPNQILAVGGLPFAVLTGAPARRVVDHVEASLLTPLGLRSLAPNEPGYCGQYRGDARARDSAYHQGTVWPWLIGSFVDGWLAVRGRTEVAREEGRRRFLAPLLTHLGVAGLGHISEVADGDFPHAPGGCPFQAWSLGELRRLQGMLGSPDQGG